MKFQIGDLVKAKQPDNDCVYKVLATRHISDIDQIMISHRADVCNEIWWHADMFELHRKKRKTEPF